MALHVLLEKEALGAFDHSGLLQGSTKHLSPPLNWID